ncbi:MAG TPA: YoaK family protein [bacterium]|nr:YoaK family protein [bacterium]
MRIDGTPPVIPRRRLVLLLGGSAGYLDAISYLALGIFTANMTGNTVLLGIAIGQERWLGMVRALLAIAAFVGGAAGGALLLRGRRRLGSVFGVEGACLLLGLAVWVPLRHPQPGSIIPVPTALPLIALLSAAMGAQSAAVRRVGEQRISTTYVTGTLTSLAVDTVTEILARRARRSRPAADAPPPSKGTLSLLTGIWAAYVAGALVGGFSQQRWGFWSVVLPVVVLAGMAAWDLSRSAPSAPPTASTVGRRS